MTKLSTIVRIIESHSGVLFFFRKESTLRVHPDCSFFVAKGRNSSNATKSSIDSIPTDWFIFDEMNRLGRVALIRGVTAISPMTVLLFAGPSRSPSCQLDPEGAVGKRFNNKL